MVLCDLQTPNVIFENVVCCDRRLTWRLFSPRLGDSAKGGIGNSALPAPPEPAAIVGPQGRLLVCQCAAAAEASRLATRFAAPFASSVRAHVRGLPDSSALLGNVESNRIP